MYILGMPTVYTLAHVAPGLLQNPGFELPEKKTCTHARLLRTHLGHVGVAFKMLTGDDTGPYVMVQITIRVRA